MTTVFLAGAFGKMGRAIQERLAEEADLSLVGVLGRTPHEADVPVFTDLTAVSTPADVWVDVTAPEAAFANGQYALTHGFDLVVGTSGLRDEDVATLGHLAQKEGRSVLIVPNFSISAVLLMKYAEDAAKYFADGEVIEIHNPFKKDSPSGTAKATAERMAAARQMDALAPVRSDQPARGQYIDDIPVHALRLPGYVAEQEVVFGGAGETLRIKQTSFTRESFMGGVMQAIRGVNKLGGLAVGLENVL
jgi:4-hydroxy-tetrahydrodipicolinate reductase